jgi:hypothetical protein
VGREKKNQEGMVWGEDDRCRHKEEKNENRWITTFCSAYNEVEMQIMIYLFEEQWYQ